MRFLRLTGAALVLVAALAGCAESEAVPEAPATPAPSSTAITPPVSLGGEGMDVRYLDQDGTVKTLRVEDFPR